MATPRRDFCLPFPRGTARRQHPRLHLQDAVDVQPLTSSIAATGCRNLSLEGFLLESASPIVPGTRARFQIETADGFIVTVQAIAIHARVAAGSAARYLSGWEFLNDGRTSAAVERMLGGLLAATAVR